MQESFKIPSATFPTLTGSIVTFNSQYAGLPLKSHSVDVDYTGNAISNCFVVNMADNTNISYFQGLLIGTYGFVDLGSLTWTKAGDYPEFRANYASNNIPAGKNLGSNVRANAICIKYLTISPNDAYRGETTGIAIVTEYISVGDADYSSSTAEQFKTAMNGVYLIYELATPTTPTITEAQFNTLLSAFNISGEAFKIPFDTPIYGGSYDCLTGIVTSDKDSGGGDVSPIYQQTATANCETNLGVNNIWADTGDTTLQYPKFG